MFSIAKTVNDYTWPVYVQLPVDGGRFEKHTFTATFRRVSQSRITEIVEAVQAGGTTDVKLASEVLVGWADITDGEADLEYSEASKARLLDIPAVAVAVVRSFLDSITGAPRKN